LFLEIQCVTQGSIGSTPLYNAYRAWAVENGFRVLTITNFGRRANQAGFRSRHTSVGNVYDVRPKTSTGYMNGVKYSGVQPSARPPGKSDGSGDP
jgi:phage/plasmid-associated DNA primase